MAKERLQKLSHVAFSTQNPNWNRAFSLVERLPSLPPSINKLQNLRDFQLAQEKYQWWQEQPPFNTSSYFKDRLAADQITEQELLYLLSEPTENIQKRLTALPDWQVKLNDLAGIDTLLNIGFSCLDNICNQNEILLLQAIKPLVGQGLDQLNSGIEQLIKKQESSTLPFAQDQGKRMKTIEPGF